MRTTFAVGKVDPRTSQLVLVTRVAGAVRRGSGAIGETPFAAAPRGPWSVRALVHSWIERTH